MTAQESTMTALIRSATFLVATGKSLNLSLLALPLELSLLGQRFQHSRTAVDSAQALDEFLRDRLQNDCMRCFIHLNRNPGSFFNRELAAHFCGNYDLPF